MALGVTIFPSLPIKIYLGIPLILYKLVTMRESAKKSEFWMPCNPLICEFLLKNFFQDVVFSSTDTYKNWVKLKKRTKTVTTFADVFSLP